VTLHPCKVPYTLDTQIARYLDGDLGVYRPAIGPGCHRYLIANEDWSVTFTRGQPAPKWVTFGDPFLFEITRVCEKNHICSCLMPPESSIGVCLTTGQITCDKIVIRLDSDPLVPTARKSIIRESENPRFRIFAGSLTQRDGACVLQAFIHACSTPRSVDIQNTYSRYLGI
jgi:hypothetical protein